MAATVESAASELAPPAYSSVPRSFTTTAAAWRPSASAHACPMPLPAPVTNATRPCKRCETSVIAAAYGHSPVPAPRALRYRRVASADDLAGLQDRRDGRVVRHVGHDRARPLRAHRRLHRLGRLEGEVHRSHVRTV